MACAHRVHPHKHWADCRPKQFEGFLTGFLVEDAAPFGPPGLAALTDGLLLVSDDDTSWPSQPRADRRRL